MAALQPQKLRIEFLIALTIVVAVFGIVKFMQARRKQHRRFVQQQTRQQARDLTAGILAAYHDQLSRMASAPLSRIQRDALALQAQVEALKEGDGEGAEAAFEHIRENLARLENDEPAVFPRGESFLRAYHSLADETNRPYSISVPKAYTDERPWPVVFLLHGHMGFRDGQAGTVPSYAGAITVRPEGRRASDYMYNGEDDVLAVLDDLCAIYNVDRTRVYLTGASMGGTGCWNLGVHYPDIFRGIAPAAANAYHQAWEKLWGWNPKDVQSHEHLRAFLHASFSPVSYAENLEHTRIVVTHGTGDTVVPVEHARAMVDRLRNALGFKDVTYWELPQAGHGGFPAWTREMALGEMFGAGPARTPKHVRYRTAHLRHNRAWWVRLDRLDNPVAFSSVEARLDEGRITVATENVSALTLRLSRLPESAAMAVVDGTELALPEPPAPGRVVDERGTVFVAPPTAPGSIFSVERLDGQWRPATSRGLVKAKGLSGPISDVFRTRFMVVTGTQGESTMQREVCAREAERFAADWKLRFGDSPPVTRDVDVTDQLMRTHSLILLGGPGVNSISAELADELPIRVGRGTITLRGKRYADADVGLLMCYPNPRARHRMIVMAAGNSPGALYQAMDRFGLWFDWGVYDKYKWFDYGLFDARTVGPETFIEVGFFNNQWQLPDGKRCTLGGGAAWSLLPGAAARVAPQGVPSLASIDELPGDESGDRLALSDLLPLRIDQYRGAVGLDRTYAGHPIRIDGKHFEKGLGVKAPSAVTWQLGGRFRRFSATVGLTYGFKGKPLPARVEVEGVVFEVWGDGRLLATTETLSWKEDGIRSTVFETPIEGVGELKLVARPQGGRTWLYGGAVWGDPSVSR